MRLLWLNILFLFGVSAGAQTFDFKNYNVEDGLAQSQVYCIFQDSKGYMWFGTNGGGASRFDGKKFQNFTVSDGAISDYVYSIAEDKQDYMYFGTYDGLQIKNQFKDIRYDSTSGLPHNAVFSLYRDKGGKVWVGTQKGVCYIDENKKPVILKDDKDLAQALVWTIYQDNRGRYWFGTREHGACMYDPSNSAKPFTWLSTDKDVNSSWVRSFNEDSKGNIFIGTVAGLIKVDENNNMQRMDYPGLSFSNLGATAISKDKNHTFWIGTNEGVVKLNGLGYETFTVKNGLCGNTILCSYIDNEGNLWFGSYGNGISKLASESVINYSTDDGLPGDYIGCIYQTKDHNYWFGVRENGLVKMSGKTFTNYRLNYKNVNAGLVDNNVNCMAEDASGNLWIGTDAGLSIFDGKNFRNYLAGNSPQTVYSIYHASNGLHYIGTRTGLLTLSSDGTASQVDLVNKLNEKGDFAIYSITEDKEHNIWLATSSDLNLGAIRLNGRSLEIFNGAKGLTDKTVYNVTRDPQGNLWFGTEVGVFYYDYKTFVPITVKEGLSSNQAYFILFDNQSRMWVGTNRGIDAVQVADYLRDRKVNIKHFGKSEGLKGLECNFNSAFKDDKGTLWFGTVKGITTYNPRFEKINHNEPTCSITDIKISFETIDLSPYASGMDSVSGLPLNLELPYSRNHVTFDFIGISQTNPAKVLYQFMLEGVDPDWVSPTNKTEVTYSSLQPGDYTFYLKAMNNDGVWNKQPLVFKFKVLPPWYRTWWFYSLCSVIALVSIYAWSSYRTKKLREDKLKLENEVALRTRELREEKEKVEVINKEVIEQKAVIEHKNLEITDSIKYAKNIQEALLPSITGLQKDFPDSFVLYMPKDIVSGDFYWFTKREGKNYFAAVDCTGHGVPGAFMSIVGNSLLTEITGEQQIYQPAEILNHLHVGVKAALNQNKGEQERRDGMDLALCAINKDTLQLEYSGANRPLWIFRNTNAEQAEIVKPDKFPIGGMEFDFEEKRRFTNHTMQLQKGDCVYVFSDGYADQFGGPKGKKFMVANLQRALADIAGKPMKEQYDHLHKIFTEWRGAYEQVDDVLVIGVRV